MENLRQGDPSLFTLRVLGGAHLQRLHRAAASRRLRQLPYGPGLMTAQSPEPSLTMPDTARLLAGGRLAVEAADHESGALPGYKSPACLRKSHGDYHPRCRMAAYSPLPRLESYRSLPYVRLRRWTPTFPLSRLGCGPAEVAMRDQDADPPSSLPADSQCPGPGSAADVRTRRSAGSGRGWCSAAGETLPMRPKPRARR
jgi:hypothetical protein